MIKHARAAFAVLFFLIAVGVLCAVSVSCSKTTLSSVSLLSGSTSVPLEALNSGAQTGKMDSQTSYAYFAFPENTVFPRLTSIQLTVRAIGLSAERFAYGFLFDDDFVSARRLKKELADRPLVRGQIPIGEDVSIAVAIPEGARGFFTYASSALEITDCRTVSTVYGWKRGTSGYWAGFSAEGGVLSAGNSALFTAAQVAHFGNEGAQIKLVFERLSALPEKILPRITLSIGDTKLTVRRAPHQSTVVFNTKLFDFTEFPVELLSGSEVVWSITLESAELFSPLTPIPADPGLVLNWNRPSWRNADFEVFRWQQVPSVLLFDTADYRVQDDFFKRLAFFVEKTGFRGRLVTDAEIAGIHGFNAHDYRAESLAHFFETARRTDFALNEKEQLLRRILLDEGIIVRTADGSIRAGEGAIVSISRESGASLRRLFMAHEGMHALYFIDSNFREQVAQVYSAMESNSLDFLKQYFSATPSLNYDLNDTYLIQNEFMGYLLQQPASAAAEYFGTTLANRIYVNRVAPDLAEHVRQTKGAAFSAAAAELDAYVFDRWGYNAGRVWLINVN